MLRRRRPAKYDSKLSMVLFGIWTVPIRPRGTVRRVVRTMKLVFYDASNGRLT